MKTYGVSFFGSTIESIHEIDGTTGKKTAHLDSVTIYPNNHYIAPGPTVQQAVVGIRAELEQRLDVARRKNWLKHSGYKNV